jgi:23S rRNA pseudouridine2605 synthase
MIRLQKILSAAGIASRRVAETLITEGRITVNGEVMCELGAKADPDADIRVDGRRIRTRVPKRYVLLYKPVNYVTTTSDPQRRPTVLTLLGPGAEGLYPVGRLDFDSEGLILLTNDGELADRLTHPRHEVPRTYEVRVFGAPDDRAMARLREGIALDGKRTSPAQVRVIRTFEKSAGAQSIVEIVIREGRNRQVRRMCRAVGLGVITLARTRIGSLTDQRLKPGMYRELRPEEVRQLRVDAGLAPKTDVPMTVAATTPRAGVRVPSKPGLPAARRPPVKKAEETSRARKSAPARAKKATPVRSKKTPPGTRPSRPASRTAAKAKRPGPRKR